MDPSWPPGLVDGGGGGVQRGREGRGDFVSEVAGTEVPGTQQLAVSRHRQQSYEKAALL